MNVILIHSRYISTAKKRKPRYVRINTNKISIKEVTELLEGEGFIKVEKVFENYADFLNSVNELQESEYLLDMHVSGLLVFSSLASKYFARHRLVQEKRLFLQDKGTCLVSEILEPRPGSTVLDMCAAPGMKSIHCSNIMQNKGTIYSVERDFSRYKLLCDMSTKADSSIISPIHADILEIGKYLYYIIYESLFQDLNCR